METRHHVENRATLAQRGFTLIEIIAVLVILGFLAVVAIPQYTALQDEAKNRAGQAVIAAAQSQLSMDYARSLLDTTYTFAPATSCGNVSIDEPSGETWTLTCTALNAGVSTITLTSSVAFETNPTGTWTQPQ